MEFIGHFIRLSGGLPIVMAVLLLVAMAIILDRVWFFYRVFGAGDQVEESLRRLGHRDLDGLRSLGERYAHTLQGGLVLQALTSRTAKPEALAQHLDEELLWSLPQLDRYLWLLDSAATLGPLLGLFGTIIGMIDTFDVLSSTGAAVKATGGIADALLSTGMGLFIAIVAVFFLNLLNKRLRLAIHQLDLIRVLLLNRLCEAGSAAAERDDPHLDAHRVLDERPERSDACAAQRL